MNETPAEARRACILPKDRKYVVVDCNPQAPLYHMTSVRRPCIEDDMRT